MSSESVGHRLRMLVVLLTAQFALLVWYGTAAEVSILGVLVETHSRPVMYTISAIAMAWVVLRWLRDWQFHLPSLTFRPSTGTQQSSTTPVNAVFDRDEDGLSVSTDGGRPADD